MTTKLWNSKLLCDLVIVINFYLDFMTAIKVLMNYEIGTDP